ncbi:MAG: hypothetical protein QOD57_4782, partial [Actinomycetota bacterium]|nr:hypothetical protein [Actinomycetota bacterium]
MDPRTKAQRLILRGYGPLAGLVVVLLFLTLLVPSRPLTSITLSGAADTPAAPVPVPTGEGTDAAGDAATVPVGGEAVTGTTMGATASSGPAGSRSPGTRTSASGTPGTARAGGPTAGATAGAAPGKVAGAGTVTVGRD